MRKKRRTIRGEGKRIAEGGGGGSGGAGGAGGGV